MDAPICYSEVVAVLLEGFCPECKGPLGVAPGREVDPRWCDRCASYWYRNVGHIHQDSHRGPIAKHFGRRYYPDGSIAEVADRYCIGFFDRRLDFPTQYVVK